MAIFELTPDILNIAEDAITSLINELGKNCRIYYPARLVPCGCGSEDNHYVHGGVLSNPNSDVCVLCGGKGLKTEETYETIKMLINWNPKEFQEINPAVLRVPNGSIKAKGFIADMSKLSRCEYMIPHIEIAAYGHYKFKLVGEPISPQNIVKGKYFVSFWERS